MTRPMKLLIALLAVLSLTPAVRAQAGEKHVAVDVLADTTAVTPGKAFTVGVRFKIDAGWHIYWTNPGDSGLATRVSLDLPAGYTAGPVEFPAPKVIKLPGDIVNYGYEDEVMLLVPVTPPKDAADGQTVTVKAKASWLVCQDNCVPGKGSASVDVPVRASGAAAANADVFGPYKAQVPVAADPKNVSAATPTVEANPTADGYAAALGVLWKTPAPADVQWVPDVARGLEVSHIEVVTSGGGTTVTFRVKADQTAGTQDKKVNGLLIYTPAAGTRTALLTSIAVPVDSPATDKKK